MLGGVFALCLCHPLDDDDYDYNDVATTTTTMTTVMMRTTRTMMKMTAMISLPTNFFGGNLNKQKNKTVFVGGIS